MGYCVTSLNVNLFIPRENFDAAFRALCELNDRNDLKGGYRSPEMVNPPATGPRTDRWFSWMPWNYSLTCTSLVEVLEAAQFDVTESEKGLRINCFIGEKMGDEELFLAALAPFYDYSVEPFIEWEGEDNAWWRNEYHQDGTVTELIGQLIWVPAVY
jgi:hypothetical protein